MPISVDIIKITYYVYFHVYLVTINTVLKLLIIGDHITHQC